MESKCHKCKYGYLEGEWSTQRCKLESENKLILILGNNGNCPYFTLKEYWEPGY